MPPVLGAGSAGARTFLLLGLLGGIAGHLGRQGHALPAAVLLAGGAGLAVAAYLTAARRALPDAVDGTTEAAALTVLSLGLLAGLGSCGWPRASAR